MSSVQFYLFNIFIYDVRCTAIVVILKNMKNMQKIDKKMI